MDHTICIDASPGRFFGSFLIDIRKEHPGREKPFSNEKRSCFYSSFLLGGLYKLFPAFGTGDGDLSLSLGNSHLLVTPGTIVIAVFLVF